MRNRWSMIAVLAAVVPIAALGVTNSGSGATAATRAVSGSITFDGVWTGAEAKSFGAVISAFNKTYPNVHVNYKPVGDNLPQVVSTAVAGGHPPDMADIAQPGLIKQFADQHKLKPITYAKGTVAANFNPVWLKLGTFNNRLYGIVFKASNKSTVWYNVHAFKNAGVKAPTTWPQLINAAKTVQASGTPPYSVAGADGWTLTDLFENIYLRSAGLAKYNALSEHKLKWTDPSVKQALTIMAQVLGNTSQVYGGTSGALQTDFPTSVNNVWQNPPKAAMVFEADFVPGSASVKAKAGTDYNLFAFPSVNGSKPAVEIGGDTIVAFNDNPAIEAFVKFLATPAAATAWAKRGGFGTGNKHVPASVYPDPITRAAEAPIGKAKSVVFDMSDEQPSAFGATVGQGEWGIFQDFLRNPKNIAGIQSKLEAAAAKAYK